MRNGILWAALSILLAGCTDNFPTSLSAPNSSPSGNYGGATPGGIQDMALARELVAGGVVPPAAALLVEGIFSEYDLPLAGAECTTTLDIRGALGWQDDSGWLQLGLSSNVDMERFARPSLGLVLLVDVSGSMGWGYDEYGQPAQITRDLMLTMLENFGAHDVVGIATFASTARIVQDFIPGDRHGQLRETTQALSASGSTNMEAGMSVVRGMFAEAEIQAEQQRLILLTDAQPNVGATSAGSFMELAANLEHAGIGLTIIGTGIGLNPDVMTAMVNLTGGNGFSISNAGQVPQFMDDNWPWMVCPIAYDLEVDANPSGGLTVERGFGFAGDNGELRTASVFLSKRRGALLLKFDGGPFERLGADLLLSYRTPTGETIGQTLTLQLPSGASLDEAGRYFEAYSVQKTTALAQLVDGMRQAAEIYMPEREGSLQLMATTVQRFASDLAALSALNPADGLELRRELSFAEQMLQLMEAGARQGTLYGS